MSLISNCSMLPAWHQLVSMSGHVEESETARKLQLYATSIYQVHSFVCQLDYNVILITLSEQAITGLGQVWRLMQIKLSKTRYIKIVGPTIQERSNLLIASQWLFKELEVVYHNRPMRWRCVASCDVGKMGEGSGTQEFFVGIEGEKRVVDTGAGGGWSRGG